MSVIDTVKYKEQIINLWQSVFGDDREYIEFFLDNCKNKICLGTFSEEQLCSMLFLLDVSYSSYKGKYVFAVATEKSHRNKGYAGGLIEEAKLYMDDFLCLVPAEKSLFSYYEKHGFNTKLYSSKSINPNYKNARNSSYDEYFTAREKKLSFPHIAFSDSEFIYKENIFNGGDFFISNNEIFAVRYGKTAEVLSKNCSLSEFNEAKGMIYSKLNLPNGYIGFVLD